MDRLISKNKVLEAIDNLKANFTCYDSVTLDEVASHVKAIPSADKWIPVSERLPEKNVWVLVTVVQGSGWYVEIMRIDKYKGMFTDNIDYYDSIIAWMPLPKPYEPQESEEV